MTYILYIWAIVEVALILYALYKIKKIITIYREDKQVYYYTADKIESVLTQLYGKYKILSFLLSETMIFYYAFLGWFIQKHAFKDVSEYTYSKDTMYGVFFWVIFVSTMMQTPIVHYFLSLWSVKVAWVVTGLSIYGLIWLLGDYMAINHTPIKINETHLYIHIGLRSKIDIAFSNIDTISANVKEEEKEIYTALVLMPTVEPNIYITLKEKVSIKGLFGSSKMVDKVALYVDEPKDFLNDALEHGYRISQKLIDEIFLKV